MTSAHTMPPEISNSARTNYYYYGFPFSDSVNSGCFGKFLIPLMIGAKDLVLPRLNLLSWYFYTTGGILVFPALCACRSSSGRKRSAAARH